MILEQDPQLHQLNRWEWYGIVIGVAVIAVGWLLVAYAALWASAVVAKIGAAILIGVGFGGVVLALSEMELGERRKRRRARARRAA